jgi:hypothetical protein
LLRTCSLRSERHPYSVAIPRDKFPLLRAPSLSSLDPFNSRTLLRFVCYEMPLKVHRTDAEYLRRHIGRDFTASTYNGIYQLYMEIMHLLEDINEKELFIGPPSAQFLTGDNSVVATRSRISANDRQPVALRHKPEAGDRSKVCQGRYCADYRRRRGWSGPFDGTCGCGPTTKSFFAVFENASKINIRACP